MDKAEIYKLLSKLQNYNKLEKKGIELTMEEEMDYRNICQKLYDLND